MKSFIIIVTLALAQLTLGGAATAPATPAFPPPDPAKPVNYIDWLNKRVTIPAGQNAADDYRAAFAKIKSIEKTPAEKDLDKASAGPWSDCPELAAWLTANASALDAFRQGGAKPQCCFAASGGFGNAGDAANDPRTRDLLVGLLMPHLNSHRAAANLLLAEGWRAFPGDPRPFGRNVGAILASARHLESSDPFLIAQLVAMGCRQSVYQAIPVALKRSNDPGALSKLLLPILAADIPADSRRGLVGERLFSLDTCQRIYVPGAQAGQWTVHAPVLKILLGSTVSSNASGFQIAMTGMGIATTGYDASLRDFNAAFDALDEWIALPYYRAVAEQPKLDQQLAAIRQRNPLVRMLLPSLSGVSIRYAAAAATRNGTHLIVHLHAHRVRTGSYPDSLAQLVAPGLATLRTDPFSGQDLIYKKDGTSFVLYSVGANLKDDQGQRGRNLQNGDLVCWPVAE